MMALADVAVVVKDAREAARWWKEVLSFESFTIGGEGRHAVLIAPPGERFVLHLCEGFAPLESGDTGIAFLTDEIDAQVARMSTAGVRFPEPLKEKAWGKMAKFADPDGNVFWLLEAPTAMVRKTLRSCAPAGVRRQPTKRRSRTGSRHRSAS